MILKVVFLFLIGAIVVQCHPTMYKYKDNNVLEADLVPVSSTVIPLPQYKVGFGINVGSPKDVKAKKPEGPIELITVHTKKKPLPTPKTKQYAEMPEKHVAKRD